MQDNSDIDKDRISKLQKRYEDLKDLKDLNNVKKSKEVYKSKTSKTSKTVYKLRRTFYISPSIEEQINQRYFQARLDLNIKIGKIDFCEAILEAGLKHIEDVYEILKKESEEAKE